MNSTTSFDVYLPHIIIAGQGLVTCVGNGLLLATITSKKALRIQKEMLIIAGMAGVDTIYGLGAFLFGIYRLALIADGSSSAKVTQWDCFSGSPFFIMNIGTQLSALMNTFISVDRFIAVAFAVRYRALHFHYVIKAFVLIGAYGMISCLAMFASSYSSPPIAVLNRLCLVPPFPAWYNIFQLSFTAGIGLLNVLIYIGVYVAHGRMLKAVVHERLNDQQAKRQRRLTVTIGVITVSTCVLSVAPAVTIVICLFAGMSAPFGSTLGIMIRMSPHSTLCYLHCATARNPSCYATDDNMLS